MSAVLHHSMEHSTRWSRPAWRSSDIQGSLLLTNAGLLLIGAWATLGFSPISSALVRVDSRGTHPLALEVFDDGCSTGDVTACNNLGVSYERGYGTDRDVTVAHELFVRACRAGSAEACNNQGALLERNWVAGANLNPARDLYEQACRHGSALGCSNLGALYAKGKGVRRDRAKARWLFDRACQAGAVMGCENRIALEAPSSGRNGTPGLSAGRNAGAASELNARSTLAAMR